MDFVFLQPRNGLEQQSMAAIPSPSAGGRFLRTSQNFSHVMTFLCNFRRWSRTAGFRAAVLTFTSSETCPYWDTRGLQEQSFRHQVGLPGEPCKQHLQAFSTVDTMDVHRARENTLNVCDLSRHIRVISDRNKIVIDHLGPVGIRTSRFLK